MRHVTCTRDTGAHGDAPSAMVKVLLLAHSFSTQRQNESVIENHSTKNGIPRSFHLLKNIDDVSVGAVLHARNRKQDFCHAFVCADN